MAEDRVDQTEGDKVTGVDVVEGVLTFRRHDGSETTYALIDALPIEEPEDNLSVWNDDGTIKLVYSILPELPTSDPEVAGALWNDGGDIMVSSGP